MSTSQFKAKGFLVWGICALFFLYEFFLRTVLGSYQHPIMYDLQLNSFEFSLLSATIFLLIYGLMQIPAGLIVDNFGLKRAIIIGALACAISSLGFAYSSSYSMAIFFRMFGGFGASFGFICLLISVHDWMPRKYNAIFIGLSQFIGTLGPMIAAGPLEEISASGAVDWRTVFIYLGAFGVTITILALLFVENNHQKSGKYVILYKPERISTSIKRLFHNIQVWYIAVLSAGLYTTIEYLSENEGRSFLELKDIDPASASYMITISWFGYALGCPLSGFLSDLLYRRKVVVMGCAFIGLAAISTIIYSYDKTFLQLAFFFLGVSASGQTVCFATIAEHFKKQFVAVGFGLNNAMIMITAAINAPLIGLWLDSAKVGSVVSVENYITTFNILIFMAVIAVVISVFFIKETYCKSQVDFTYLKVKSPSK